MNEPATKTPTQVGAIQEEHAELLCLADQLCAACYPSSRDRDTVQDTSQTLAAELVEHFALEERGGYFADALERAPQLEQFAHELQTQHEGLLESVEALNKLARSGVESDAWWRKIEADVASLTSRLRKHEAGERELLQRAYGEDIGTKD